MATHTAASPTIDTSDQPVWHALDQAEVEQRLETCSEGLTAEQVIERQERFGPKELPEEPPTSPLVLLLHQINNPLIYILIAAADHGAAGVDRLCDHPRGDRAQHSHCLLPGAQGRVVSAGSLADGDAVRPRHSGRSL